MAKFSLSTFSTSVTPASSLVCDACGTALRRLRHRGQWALRCPIHGEWTPNVFICKRTGTGPLRVVRSKRDHARCVARCKAITKAYLEGHRECL